MRARTVVIAVVAGLTLSFAAYAGASIEKKMGPQVFAEPSVESVGGPDSTVVSAVEAAVAVARKYQFHYDASGSSDGLVVVNALWKGDPVTMTMKFSMKEESLYIASRLSQSGTTAIKHGQKIEELFYSELFQETKRRGLEILSDPNSAATLAR